MMNPVRNTVALASAIALAALAGCGRSTPRTATQAVAATATIHGTVHGGQQPVSNALIQLYAANTTATAGAATPLIGTAIYTGSDGSFNISNKYTCPTVTSTPVYLVATGGNPGLGGSIDNAAITIIAALGPCSGLGSSTFVNMNELTTVAAVWSFANTMSDYAHMGSPSPTGLAAEYTLAAQLVDTTGGDAPGLTLAANSYAPVPKLNTMADILASCINSDGSGATGNTTPCGKLFNAAATTGPLPTDIVGAAIDIAANPTTNLATLFALAGSAPPFQPTLSAAPSNWSMNIAAIAWSNPAAITYGTALSATQLNATASIPGSFTYTPASGTTLGAGSKTLSATFAPTDAGSYPAIAISTPLTVNQAVPTITWAVPAPIVVGTALSGTQLNATTTAPGNFVYNPASGTVLSAGTQTLNTTFTPTDAVDYAGATKSVSLFVAGGNPSYTWGNVQVVGGGYVTGIVAHPTAQNVRYARTDVGGAYAWNQSAGAWVAITDFYPRSSSNYGGCESIAVDPNDSTRVYLAMGEYAAYNSVQFLLSSNQGASFTTVTVNGIHAGSNDNGRTAGERLAVDPNLGTTLYFGSRLNGLWRSTNRGTSWSQVTSFPVTGPTGPGNEGSGIVFVDFVASSGSNGSQTPVIYVGVSDTGTSNAAAASGYSSLYRSTDAGVTWQAVPGQPTGAYPMRGVIGPDGVLYIAYAYGAGTLNSYSSGAGPGGITTGFLYKYALPPNTTPTGAGTWTNITPGTSARQNGSQGGFASIAVDPEVPGVIMATTLDDYYPGDDIYRSTNGGASWVSVVLKQGATFNTSLSPWVTFGGSSTSTGTWPTSLIIDPFNSNHVMYGTGQTLWDSTNVTASDSGGKVAFNIGAKGIEETVSGALASPPTGPLVVSGVGDLGGFVHTSLTTSPASGMIENPRLGQIQNIDFAQSQPATFAFVGGISSGNAGGYSTNSGSSWTPFTTALPPGSTDGGGDIAVSADGSTFVWAPSDAPVAYSTNKGSTWTASSGATAESGIASDRINPLKFYILAGTTLQMSVDGGKTFANVATGLAANSVLANNYTAEGDLWLGSSSTGLYHSTNSGTSFSAVSGFSQVYAIGFGAPASTGGYPTIYLIGQNTSGVYGFYRSTNQGSTWIQINDTAHQWGYVNHISGDPKTFGRVYLTTGGRGIVYGDSPY